jgi:hypothetical protein
VISRHGAAPWSGLPGCHAGIRTGILRRTPARTPAWQPEGRSTAQIGAGIQREGVYALQSPLVATGTLFARLNRHLMLQVDAGRSTSSLERINSGRESYARFVLAAGLAYRFE